MVQYKVGEFHYYCADLIDRYDYADQEGKLEITESFPFPDAKFITEDKVNSAYLAAVVEHLCRRDSIRIPEWVHDRKFFLQSPYFDGPEDSKAKLIVESPVEFRRRNIFVSKNMIDRTSRKIPK